MNPLSAFTPEEQQEYAYAVLIKHRERRLRELVNHKGGAWDMQPHDEDTWRKSYEYRNDPRGYLDWLAEQIAKWDAK